MKVQQAVRQAREQVVLSDLRKYRIGTRPTAASRRLTRPVRAGPAAAASPTGCVRDTRSRQFPVQQPPPSRGARRRIKMSSANRLAESVKPVVEQLEGRTLMSITMNVTQDSEGHLVLFA